MNNELTRTPRTVIRIGRMSLAFAMPKSNNLRDIILEPYTVKSGMSMAANLREAFRESVVLTHPNTRAQVLIDAPVMLVPMEEFDESQTETLFYHTFPDNRNEAVMTHIIPDLNCVAVFSINKDVRMVISDHFDDVRIMPLTVPVWQHLHQTSHAGQAHKLYVFFHDRQLTVMAFAKNRFKFCNTFNSTEVMDSAYFILYTWQTLVMDHRKDELFIVGDFNNVEALKSELKKYVQNVFSINPAAEFNRAPVTQLPNVTYDIICLCV